MGVVMKNVIESYNETLASLPRIRKEKGGGKSRGASGMLYEDLIKGICDVNNIVAKSNDMIISEEIDGLIRKNLQVDKHLYYNGVLKKMVESKGYLDLCYYIRALFNFVEMEKSPHTPNDLEYAIFAGQHTVNEDNMKYYKAWFKRETGKEVKFFTVCQQKQRSATKAVYMEKYADDFKLDMKEVNEFVEWLVK